LSSLPETPSSVAQSGICRAAWSIDVSRAVPLPGRFEIAVDVIAPSDLSPSAQVVVLACIPGGFLSRRYFDLEVDGDRRYSFAEAMARRGFVTLAFDSLGVGDSSKPEPVERGYALGVEAIARANQAALAGALRRLAGGDPASRVPPLVPVASVGIGHSMGSALTVEQQALARPHRALVLFSFTTAGVPRFLSPRQRALAGDPMRARREIGALARETLGSPYPERPEGSREDRSAAFGVGSAPPAATEALRRASTNLLGTAGLLSMIPGGFTPPADLVDVPVLVALGDGDLHGVDGLASMFPRSPAFESFVLEDCRHCHFVAGGRERLWTRVAEWIPAALASLPSSEPILSSDRSALPSSEPIALAPSDPTALPPIDEGDRP